MHGIPTKSKQQSPLKINSHTKITNHTQAAICCEKRVSRNIKQGHEIMQHIERDNKSATFKIMKEIRYGIKTMREKKRICGGGGTQRISRREDMDRGGDHFS